jgi:hypothetical protein
MIVEMSSQFVRIEKRFLESVIPNFAMPFCGVFFGVEAGIWVCNSLMRTGCRSRNNDRLVGRVVGETVSV